MLSNSAVRESSVKTLQQLLEISQQVYAYYFQNPRREGSSRHLFKLKKSVIDLYDYVFQRSTSKPSYEQKMVELFKTALQQHLLKHMPVLNSSISSHKLIKTFNSIWDSYMSYLFILCKRIFSYLNRYYVPANQYQSLQKIGMDVFIGVFFTQNTSKAFFGAYSIDLKRMRQQKIINNHELCYFSESLAMIANTKYFPLLKEIYYGQSENFYQQVYEKHANDQPINYLNLVNNMTYFEELLQKKAICFVESQTHQLFQIFKSKLVSQYTDKLLRHPYGFRYFLKNHKTQQLRITYKTFYQTEGFEKLRNQLYEFLLEQGMVKLNEKSKTSPENFIHSLYDFFIAYSTLISDGFNKNEQMQISLRNGFEKLISKFEKMAEILFEFTKAALNKGSFAAQKYIITTLFEQLSYKDQFLQLYRSYLQKKIMDGTLVYLIQKQFIKTMNQICGSQLTSQLDKILEDYIESMSENMIPASLKSQNFNVKIVAYHFWEKKFENQVAMRLFLTQPLKETWSKFQQAYCSAFPKRKLIILPIETKLNLQLKIESKTLNIRCNLIQACIIFYAWRKKQNHIKEQDLIVDLTLQKSFLSQTLHEMSNLIPQISPGIYKFNWQFSSSENVVNLCSKIQEQKKITKNIQQDRDILIQAAIVKIAKRNKEILFPELAVEITKKIKLFKPHPTSIKQAVEKLVKKDIIQEMQGGIIRYIQ